MKTRNLVALGAVLLFHPLAHADSSYQTTEQITGGTLEQMLKSQAAFLGSKMKAMFAPNNTLTMVHGNQKAVVRKDSTEITDLDAETITRIDNEKKTYTVTTFAQMRAAIPAAMQQVQKIQSQTQSQVKSNPQADQMKMNVDIKVVNTGVSKVINGFTAQEQILTVTMTMTLPPPPPGQPQPPPGTPLTMQFGTTSDIWITPDPDEVKEVKDFDQRMVKKMMEGVDTKAFMEQLQAMKANFNPAAMGLTMGGPPGSAEAMKEAYKEEEKIKGTHILEVVSEGPPGGPPPSAAEVQTAAAAPPPAPKSSYTGGQMAGDVATNTASQTASNQLSKLGGFGSTLGGNVLGAFRKKKAADAPPPPPPPAAAANGSAPGAPGAGGPLMQMTTQITNFSHDPIPASVFQVPAGYKLVQAPSFPASK
jgi:hypothetical protein